MKFSINIYELTALVLLVVSVGSTIALAVSTSLNARKFVRSKRHR